MKKRKIWLGLGSAMLATTALSGQTALSAKANTQSETRSAATSMQMAQHKGHGGETAKAKAGGEAAKAAASGGEGEGEGGAAASIPAPLRFSRDIALIRGHLLVGNELIESGRWAEALPHFLHPEEEIYTSMRADLKTFNVPPFAVALKALSQSVKAKNKEAYLRAKAAVDERLSGAETVIREKEGKRPGFIAETVLELLQTSTEEYEEAIDKGRIKNVVEYQDARGFVFEADRLFESVAGELSAKDAAAVTAVRATLADLKAVFPTAMPPAQPVKDANAFLSDVSKAELQLGKLY